MTFRFLDGCQAGLMRPFGNFVIRTGLLALSNHRNDGVLISITTVSLETICSANRKSTTFTREDLYNIQNSCRTIQSVDQYYLFRQLIFIFFTESG